MLQSMGPLFPTKESLLEEYPRHNIRLNYFEGKGRGVVAGEDIAKGALIERSPVIIIPAEERFLVDQTIIFTYAFLWEKGTTDQDMYSGEGRLGIPLGFATLLNHSPTPTAECIPLIADFAVEIRALRDIRGGEEITLEYKMDLWFTD